MVSIPLEVMHSKTEFVVTPKPVEATGFMDSLIPPELKMGYEILDSLGINIKGIPQTTAIPYMIDTDSEHTVYFINQGIGIMTIDLSKALPTLPIIKRGEQFGPSYIPQEKTGVFVVFDDGSLEEKSDAFSIDYPQHLELVEDTIKVDGKIKDSEIAAIVVNGFRAEIKRNAKGNPVTFEVPKLSVREGLNRIQATAFAKNSLKIGTASRLVLRRFKDNPMEGSGNVIIDLPSLSVADGDTLTVAASLDPGEGKLDELYVNGKLACKRKRQSWLGAGENKGCTGKVEIKLKPGVNSIVATAIDVDKEFPKGMTFADLQVMEDIVLAVKDDLYIFDASGLVPLRVKKKRGGEKGRILKKKRK